MTGRLFNAFSFPYIFWNIPLRANQRANVPKTPRDLDSKPRLFDERQFGYYYDYVVVRSPQGSNVKNLPQPFPFDLVLDHDVWQLIAVIVDSFV